MLGRRPSHDRAIPLPEPIGDSLNDEPVPNEELEGASTLALGENFKLLRTAAIGLVVIVACSFFIFLAAQTAALLRDLSYLPRPVYLASVAAMLLLWAAVAIAGAQLAVSIARLRRSPAVSLAALHELDRRSRSWSHYESAELSLRQFLNLYPRTVAQRKLLRRAGFVENSNYSDNSPSVEKLFAAREALLLSRYGTSEQWLINANRTFVSQLDFGATKLIRSAYLSVAAKTAIVPRGFLDGLVVLAASWCLIRDLCLLYGLRPGPLDTCLLLLHTLAQTLVAQQLGDTSECMQDEIQHHVADVAGRLGADVAGKALGRVAEGTINAILIRRLGWRLQRTIRPILEQ